MKQVTKNVEITETGMSDVFLGRGKSAERHPGNINYRRLIYEASFAYHRLGCRAEKTQMTQDIVTAVKQYYGGRFLRRNAEDTAWIVVSDEAGKLLLLS